MPDGVDGPAVSLLDDYRLFSSRAKESTIFSTAFLSVVGLASIVSGEQWAFPTQPGTWLAFGYIVVIAFFLNLFDLGRWTASSTSYGFVLIPLITVILATLLAGEQISPGYVAGALLVILGVWIGALRPDKRRSGN